MTRQARIDTARAVIAEDTTLVTIFTGPNDVNVITAALGGGAGGADPVAYIDQQVRAFGEDYGTLLSGVRAAARSSRVVLLNVPNLGALPYLAGTSLAQRQAAQRASVRMSTTVVNPLRTQDVSVVDLLCDSRVYQPSIYSPDGFHPNDAGHALLADEIVRVYTSRSYPVPRSACAEMSLVP